MITKKNNKSWEKPGYFSRHWTGSKSVLKGVRRRTGKGYNNQTNEKQNNINCFGVRSEITRNCFDWMVGNLGRKSDRCMVWNLDRKSYRDKIFWRNLNGDNVKMKNFGHFSYTTFRRRFFGNKNKYVVSIWWLLGAL